MYCIVLLNDRQYSSLTIIVCLLIIIWKYKKIDENYCLTFCQSVFENAGYECFFFHIFFFIKYLNFFFSKNPWNILRTSVCHVNFFSHVFEFLIFLLTHRTTTILKKIVFLSFFVCLFFLCEKKRNQREYFSNNMFFIQNLNIFFCSLCSVAYTCISNSKISFVV